MSPKKILDNDGNDLACQIAMADALHDVLNCHLGEGQHQFERRPVHGLARPSRTRMVPTLTPPTRMTASVRP
jgi:hypothetical protein